ncbi:MAG: YggS family pyridoxal phosphate-dependent enzyme [Anaerolineae bacterium]
MTIAENILQVQANIEMACGHVGRSPSEVTLVAVSKTHSPSLVLEAVEAGLQHFGENRVEEAETKIPAVNTGVNRPLTWHMIGHIQSRKARDVVTLFQQIHSVDTVKLANKLSALCVERDKTLNVLLEVNVSGETAKYGLAASSWEISSVVRESLWREIELVMSLDGINVCGLMTMAPIVEKPEQTRPVFAALCRLRFALEQSLGIRLPDLSMGMTDDYPIAIEEGATLVRIGRAIFGEREYK